MVSSVNFLIFSLSFALILGEPWVNLASGIDYQYHRHDNNNDVFILRTDRNNKKVIVETMAAKEKIKVGIERPTLQFARNTDSLTSWPTGRMTGMRAKGVAAVNGYYYDMRTGIWIGGGFANGWYVRRLENRKAGFGRGSGFVVKTDGRMLIAECVDHNPAKNYIKLIKGSVQIPISDINIAGGADSLVIYTHKYDAQTPPNNEGLDVIVELSMPAGISSSSNKVSGKVISINRRGSTKIPFDAVVIAAKGPRANKMSGIAVGDVIEIYQDLVMYDERTCKNEIKEASFGKTFSGMSVDFHFLKNKMQQRIGDNDRHPRTAFAYNPRYLYFFVVDGRTMKSRGMKIDELGEFAQKYLNATDGAALDGGGSSVMIVNGDIKNNPSDGTERPVTNGIMFAVAEPKLASSKYRPNDRVITIDSSYLMAGPGSNYNGIYTYKANRIGTIMPHTLLGVKAKGFYWWKINLGEGIIGWIKEGSIKKP